MSTPTLFNPAPLISKNLRITPPQVEAVIKLIEEGATIPFIARYRKEVHGDLDEVQIFNIQEKLTYYNALEARRQTVLKTIEEAGQLTDELRLKIETTLSKNELEDLYLPYKPKRRTRATIAKEKGLEPLAERIRLQPLDGNPQTEAEAFVKDDVASADEALAGARDILAELVSENAEIRLNVRKAYSRSGLITSTPAPKVTPEETSKYKDYFDFSQPIKKVPSHRFLAIQRGEKDGELSCKLVVDAEPLIDQVKTVFGYNAESTFAAELLATLEDAHKRLIKPSVESDVFSDMKVRADRSAVNIFAQNLRALLLAPPYSARPVIAIDPGLRTGCKCVALDATGKYLDTITIFPSQGDDKKAQALTDLTAFIEKYPSHALAIGDGTAGRETEEFVKTVVAPLKKKISVISVSESGASVYSASEIAREEFPDLDLTIRGAISIGRRLQDPLAELVKIDPKAIGVGQYQHDVDQKMLQAKLTEIVVSCVNHIGTDLNTASAPLLARVAGIGESLAKKIIAYRDENGAFKCREDLLQIAGLGPRAYEQAAGFLRIRSGSQPLDASGVHPERYELVQTIATDLETPLDKLLGNAEQIAKISAEKYVGDSLGELTLKDIVAELKKPGRDPRKSFKEAGFRKDVMQLKDLTEGMELKGIVTNVTAFGAFVNIGVHQDGLIHISQLADQFVKDPAELVKAGDSIAVRVLEVDMKRKRISLTARKKVDPAEAAAAAEKKAEPKPRSAPRNAPQGAPRPARGNSNGPRNGGQRNNGARRPRNESPRDRGPRTSGFRNNPFADL